MNFTHVFISRPPREAEELAAMLAPLGLQAILQPAFDYVALDLHAEDPEVCEAFESAGQDDLVVFTSPRAVAHGVGQLSRDTLLRVRVYAVGPATTGALGAAGIRVAGRTSAGYTSEALLKEIGQDTGKPGASTQKRRVKAFVVAAPGGRPALLEGLRKLGWQASMMMVYRSEPAALNREELAQLDEAAGVLSVWTSGNAMSTLAQRLPPATWFRLCQGDWLVISERLRRLARAFGPTRIHLAPGPGNGAIVSAIRGLL